MVKLKYPLKFVGITQDYKSYHRANDLGWNNKYGGRTVEIYACGDGNVTEVVDGKNNSMNNGDSGNFVTIEYADGYKTRTCHMLKNSIKVKVGDKVKSNQYQLLYYNEEEPIRKNYVIITAKRGVWCRKGVGFKYPKYKAIPYGTKCELIGKNIGYASGYKWDKIIYNGEEVYLPNNWNRYI